ncbi:MAG: carbamoyltransferase HypF [Bacteroidota bacterium]|nr:carbamoyltransferase HypF [Bacteroidota bacterium]
MKTFHIHIGGLVQGVGFRPHVYRIAEQMCIPGWVSNTKDGVHIEINATETAAHEFYAAVIDSPPVNAVIVSQSIEEVSPQTFTSFTIKADHSDTKPDILLTPDFAICDDCRREIMDKNNKRYHYPFTTCLHCGPRYSIITGLPYERYHTTMSDLVQCHDCATEYNEVYNRRHYSQTNSCPDCAIAMHLYDAAGHLLNNETAVILKKLDDVLASGAILAVKGTGGYLLLCDATNELSIQLLRRRKHRPAKPFALLYAGIEMAKADVHISFIEKTALKDKSGPIVLCRLKPLAKNKICTEAIAPGLDKIGWMLPCSPLLQLIATTFGKPLVATSANISGSPIIYKDEEALELLSGIADYIVSYDREIVLPQDDSVLQITPAGKKIILRRSRGLAPNYFPNPFKEIKDSILAMGGELKSAFALQDHQHLYVSQYLGNQENLASQTAFAHTSDHLLNILQTKPSLILADSHPGYFISQHGNDMALIGNIPFVTIQHHRAHFGAVLAENNLLNTAEPVLGVIWDGAGYGDDKQIWGGEFFVYDNNDMQRLVQLDYFPQLLGDKMNREPRLSALSLLKFFPAKQAILEPHFSSQEWQYYQQLINQPAELLTSSIGRLLDGIASLLGICHINTYEGEAAMRLEAIAGNYTHEINKYYPVPLKNNRLDFSLLLQDLLNDIDKEETPGLIAKRVFYSLAMTVEQVSNYFNIGRIAFSGGVFQNALLTDMMIELLANKKQLYWHRQLSPNDECIGFGQLACYHSIHKNNIVAIQEAESIQ